MTIIINKNTTKKEFVKLLASNKTSKKMVGSICLLIVVF